MDSIVVTLHKQIIKSMSKHDRDRFETIFKEMLTLQSTTEILRGLTYHKKLVVLRDALAEFDLQMLQNDSSHVPVYTFATKAAFAGLLSMCKLKSSDKTEVAISASKKSTTDKALPVSPIAKVEAKLGEVSITQSKPQKVKKSKPISLPSAKGADKVYKELCTYLASDQPPYKHVPYMDCKHTLCSFTRTLFQNIALTKCVGHKKCVPSGWFPHVGMTLWKSIASKHSEGSIFTAKSRTLKPNEMMPLSLHKKQTAAKSDVHTHSDMDYDSDSSTMTNSSSSSSGSKRKRIQSPTPSTTRSNGYQSTSIWSEEVDRDLSLGDTTSTPWASPKP